MTVEGAPRAVHRDTEASVRVGAPDAEHVDGGVLGEAVEAVESCRRAVADGHDTA